VHHADVRTLYLLRHFKSSWDELTLPDHDRPLAPRGRRAAKKLERHLRKAKVSPALVLCSPSVRTRQTLDAVLPALGGAEVRYREELYAAPAGTLRDAVRNAEPRLSSILVVGHNPGLQDLAVALAGRGDAELRRRLGEKLPTGAFVTLELPSASWAEVEAGSGELVGFVVPRELR
jgi:phosphohistidine phosphatase